MHIVPAILPKDFAEVTTKLRLVKGAADTVQIDIVDGRFAQNKTWPYAETRINADIKDADESRLIISEHQRTYLRESAAFIDFEFDLMVSKPAEVIADFVRIGASRVIVHIESMEPDALSELIKEWKHSVDVGLALKPSTPASLLEIFLHEVSFVQCMGNDRISFQGVALDEKLVLPKISKLRAGHPELTICVDIGVTIETAPRLIAAGASRLVAGSAIFGSTHSAEAIRELEALFS